MKRFVGLNAAGTTWLLGFALVGLMAGANWHLLVAVLGASLALGGFQMVLGRRSAVRHFETGRRGMWKLFALVVASGVSLILLGMVSWLAAVVVAAPVLAVVLCAAIAVLATAFAFAVLKGGWL